MHLVRRIGGVVMVGLGVLILFTRARQWAELLANDDPLPGTRYARSITDIVAVALIGFGVPVAGSWSRDDMVESISIVWFRIPRWAVAPAIAIGGFLIVVAVLVAFTT
ncbi:MAG: hypothetical protein QNJ71_11565 [Acidimicrobiia bacterium]|nr:hypothetical protein [Acidimicrobiia bacterium]